MSVHGSQHQQQATHALDVLESVQLRTQTTVNAQKLLVHDGGQRQRAERLHALVIDGFRVLVLALQLEREIIGQVATLVVAAQEPKGVRVPDLQTPKVEHTLSKSAKYPVSTWDAIPRY